MPSNCSSPSLNHKSFLQIHSWPEIHIPAGTEEQRRQFLPETIPETTNTANLSAYRSVTLPSQWYLHDIKFVRKPSIKGRTSRTLHYKVIILQKIMFVFILPEPGENQHHIFPVLKL